jgi:polyisoprenoid-binding protein YceI
VPAVAGYRIVPERSEVVVRARSSVHPITGTATELSGDVDFGAGRPDGLGGHLEVPIKGLRSANRLYDAELQRRVDARRYPVIVGEIRTATAIDDQGLFRVEGDLTFHGTTRPVTGELRVTSEGDTLVVEGEQQFDVREFGLTPPRILMLRVEPDVAVRIRLVAEPA